MLSNAFQAMSAPSQRYYNTDGQYYKITRFWLSVRLGSGDVTTQSNPLVSAEFSGWITQNSGEIFLSHWPHKSWVWWRHSYRTFSPRNSSNFQFSLYLMLRQNFRFWPTCLHFLNLNCRVPPDAWMKTWQAHFHFPPSPLTAFLKPTIYKKLKILFSKCFANVFQISMDCLSLWWVLPGPTEGSCTT